MRLPLSAVSFLLTHPIPCPVCRNCCSRMVSKSRSVYVNPAAGFGMQRALATKRRETVAWHALVVLVATRMNARRTVRGR